MAVQMLLRPGADLEGFRRAARSLIAQNIAPQHVAWSCETSPALFAPARPEEASPIALSRAVADLITLAVCHRDPERYALLYSLIWRMSQGERALPEVQTDPLVHRLEMLRKAVRRDLHKMHAFVRFRRVHEAGEARFIAWFEPGHHILEASADFFVERFRGLNWSILTPDGSLHWDRTQLSFGPPGRPEALPEADSFEAGWTAYYQSSFNPARLNTALMRKEMPVKYWRNLPEAKAIAQLVQTAPARVEEMILKEAAMPVRRNPEKAVAAMADQMPATLEALNRIIAASEPLVPGARRAVLGEGPAGARIAFVGEQPGDQEDAQGRPFIGPAGQMLDAALAEAGIERRDVYVTNAVKHFKFEQRGKKRIHQKPTVGEVKHYRWWLMRELELVHPGLVVALGATAALALSGRRVSIGKARGMARFGDFPGYVTVHPSYLLRLPDAAAKRSAYQAFLEDMKEIAALAAHPARGH